MEASRRVEFKFRLKDEEMIEQMRSMLEQLGTTPTVEPTAQATAEAQATPAPEAAATPETVQPTPEAAATPEAAQATPEPAQRQRPRQRRSRVKGKGLTAWGARHGPAAPVLAKETGGE